MKKRDLIDKITLNVLHGKSALKELTKIIFKSLTLSEMKVIEKIVRLDMDFRFNDYSFNDIKRVIKISISCEKIKSGRYNENILMFVLASWCDFTCPMPSSLTKIVGEIYHQHHHKLNLKD